jgi:hypothetical protein
MPERCLLTAEAVPSIWRVLLFRIKQAEKRALILVDWETNVFGYRLRDHRSRPGWPLRHASGSSLRRLH